MKRLAKTHTTYQDASALLVIIDGGQVQSGTSMFAALLNIDDIAVLTHHPKGLHFVQLGGQVHWCLLLLVQHSRIHWAVRIVGKIYFEVQSG